MSKTYSFSNSNRSTTGSGFSFNKNKQQEEPEKPHFQLTAQMLITELPTEIANQFIEVYKKIQENSKELSENTANVAKSTVEADSEAIRQDTLECINGSLLSLAHQIDFGQSSFSECKKDLEVSKSDFNNSSHFRGIPSPFIKRYASRINKHAEELSQSLASYTSRFQPKQESEISEQNEVQILNNLLVEQQKAILRCSSRVAALSDRQEQIRSSFYDKHKANPSLFKNDDIQQNLCAQKVQDDYKHFLSDKKQKRIKISQETDLFGNSTVEIPKKTGYGSSFRKTTTTTTTSRTTNTNP